MIKVNENGFIYDTEGRWYPPMNRKQFEIFNDRHRYLLIHGPRKSGKTFGLIHKILRHAFDVNGAMAAIVAKTLKNAKSAGVWSLLCRALPLWEANCHGFKVVEGPKTTGDTKLSFVKIRNRHGTVSEIQCHSLEYAADVEAKFKGTAYSLFWLSEGDQFCDLNAFDIICDALRMTPFIPYEDHQLLFDCNPPETGPNNWMYEKWFTFKDSKPGSDEDANDALYREGLHRILVMIDDNPQLDPREKREMIGRYKRRKNLYARYIDGKWVQDITDGHFSEVWDETAHVIGNADGDEDTWEVLVPTPACRELLTGWDVGDRNHSFHIIEKITTEHPHTKKPIISFSVLDELVVLKSKVSTTQFCEAALAKIEKWNKYQKNTHGIELRWRHWSDTSAFQWKATANTTDSAIIFAATGIRIDAAPKYRNSNHDKVDLLSELLMLNRLVVSAQLDKTRSMFANVKKGGEAEFIKENDHKHPFDSLSYPILAEAPMDFFKSKAPQTEKKREVEMVTAGV